MQLAVYEALLNLFLLFSVENVSHEHFSASKAEGLRRPQKDPEGPSKTQ